LFYIVGDLERIFLVLRDKIALSRVQSRDNPVPDVPGPSPSSVPVPSSSASFHSAMPGMPAPSAPGPIPYDVTPARGNKRAADDDPSSPSKRLAL